MNNTHVIKITAVTQVFPAGQKCTRAVLEYDQVISAASVRPDIFTVQGRVITDAYAASEPDGTAADGRFVILLLSQDDEAAATYFSGEAWENISARLVRPCLTVSQTGTLQAADGTEVSSAPADGSTAVRNLLVDDFVQGSFEGLAYSLFVPKNYDPNRKYPLVQFIHDAGVCSDEPQCALAQGIGALVWMTEEAQAEQECFVLAPQFRMPTIVDDDWNVDHRLEIEKKLLDQIVSEYSIDRSRLYTTGQSMGCMASMVLNLRYPDLFAASLFVAGQWDEQAFHGSGLQNKPFWFIVSEGDARAFPGMNQILVQLERDGAKISREVWKTGLSQSDYSEMAHRLEAEGSNMIYTPFEITSVADGWHSSGVEHHMATWQHAYSIDAIREWLFAQHK